MKHCTECGEPMIPLSQIDEYPRVRIVSSNNYENGICLSCSKDYHDKYYDYEELDFHDKYEDRWSDYNQEEWN